MSVDVFIDNNLVYKFDDPQDARATPWHLIPLVPEHYGKQLELRFESTYTKIGPMGPVSFGSQYSHLIAMVDRDLTRIGLAFFFLVLGSCAILIAIRNGDHAYYGFGVMTVATAGYTIRYTHLKQLVVDNLEVWFYVWSGSLLVLMIGLLVFVQAVFNLKKNRVMVYLLAWNLILSTVGGIILFFQYLDLAKPEVTNFVLASIRVTYVLDAIGVVAFATLLATRGNFEARLLTIGLALGLFFVIKDAAWALGLTDAETTVGHWGAFTFIMSLVSILVYRYGLTLEQLRQYSLQLEQNARERSLLVTDLHDGIGAITANISFLARLAQKNRHNSSETEALETISSLSEQGLDEIRSYMNTLDEDYNEWVSVVADLRRYGAQTLEPHNLDFHFSSHIDEDVESVSSLVSLHLFRIFKEALTNILKHAGATAVVIDIKIDQKFSRLSIHDDGHGVVKSSSESNNSDSQHRGLASMKSRAERMGGSLRISELDGFTIHCTLPNVMTTRS